MSLFYPPEAVHVDGVDLLDDVRSILQNLIMKLLVRHLCPLLLTSRQHQLVCYRIKMSFCVRAAGKPSRPLTSEAQQKERGTTHLLLLASRTLRGSCTMLLDLRSHCMLMMMLFICSSRNNNQPNCVYPLGTLHSRLKKAYVMILPSCPLWHYDDPFSLWLTWWCTKHFTVQPPSVPIYINDRH